MSKVAPFSSGYPFVTVKQVRDRLDSHDRDFVREAMEILHRRFVNRDLLEPPAGWMASHRVVGEAAHTALFRRDCSEEDVARAAGLAKRYAKQVAKVLRDAQIARDPRLGLAAAVFGVRPSQELDDMDDPYADGDDDAAGDGAPRNDPLAETPTIGAGPTVAAEKPPPDVPPARRRGRPPGSKSKSKVKADAQRGTPTKRRRR